MVTGGEGYVGSAATVLIEAGHDVTVVDDLSTGHRDAVPEGAVFHHVDVCDEQALAHVMQARPSTRCYTSRRWR